jgi:two-component system sensor histidine kinase and response regulator WspE
MSARTFEIDESMLELYRMEAEEQTKVLVERLLALERAPSAPDHLEACMRAAHSLKGAARIVGFEAGVKVAHAMEDCFVAAQRGELVLDQRRIDAFLRDVDVLRAPRATPAQPAAARETADAVERLLAAGASAAAADRGAAAREASTPPAAPPAEPEDRMLRVTAQHLDRLLRLAGESLVEARRQKRGEDHARRLYDAALACRMRPFADGAHAFPRLVRDVARSVGKSARLEIRGESTQVDRDILALLEAPLGHLLRNAVDHGIETPEERRAAGKPDEGLITLEARHHSGVLLVGVDDDGRGIDLDVVRRALVQRGLASSDNVAKLSPAELLEFLFLPGFTLKDAVTEVSGRGVGLDVVREVLHKVHGKVRVTAQPGHGSRFQLQLPLTLSVQRTLLVSVAEEPYALPLASIARTASIPRDRVEYLEGRPYYHDGRRAIALVSALHLLHDRPGGFDGAELKAVFVGAQDNLYGLLVDDFLGERELVVRALDPRLGKIKDVAAAAVLEEGEPVLILDVEDLTRSIERIVRDGERSIADAPRAAERPRSRILVVDDSLTVRELQRKLLANHGYVVDVATDGMDGLNTARSGRYDLIITDVDMPRMDGIELITRLKKDARLGAVPVMIVSYKDRPEDRRRGLDAGADRYLAKGSFHDEALIEAVRDLVGEAVVAAEES